MPVKISNSDQTNPLAGIMHITDVHKVLNDYKNKVQLTCADPSRNPIQKRFYFDIDFRRIKQVLGLSGSVDNETNNEAPKIVRINVSLNLSNQLNCEQTESIENSVSILVCGVGEHNKSKLNHGDFILTEGFSDHKDLGIWGQSGGGPCCVQGSPLIIS